MESGGGAGQPWESEARAAEGAGGRVLTLWTRQFVWSAPQNWGLISGEAEAAEMSFQYRALQLYITKQCFVFKNLFPQSALSHLFLSFVRFFCFIT